MSSVLKTQWMKLNDSYFLMIQVHREGWQLAEWQNIGEVHLRQIYLGIHPVYVSVAEDRKRREKTVLGNFQTLHEAQSMVEATCGAEPATS